MISGQWRVEELATHMETHVFDDLGKPHVEPPWQWANTVRSSQELSKFLKEIGRRLGQLAFEEAVHEIARQEQLRLMKAEYRRRRR